ncbi:DNA starvation/stationary phase protection protein Dps [Vampirovibrio sp.]|uniref:DNA starvation/stationary phase protection protein Dps n=1 Tax=Vampirovibrio sp. TaxID=2717857 RepID=UPI003593EF67
MATMPKASTKQTLHSTRIDLSEPTRLKVVELLNQSLAATLDLKTHVKQAHWNVKGKDFYQLHELFDQIAGEVEEFVDLIAERVTTLGGTAMGTARLAAQNSILPEYPHDIFTGLEHIKALVERFAAFGAHIRTAIDTCDELGDATTADLYTQISRNIDMRLWFLEAHIQA